MNIENSQSTASKNKDIIRHAFTEINNGNFEPFIGILDDNFKLTVPGSLPISGTFVGVQELSEKFIAIITNALEVQPKIVIDEMVAEGDFVIMKAHGEGGIAKNGKEYNNTYCHFMRLKDGKLIESTEYIDTELRRSALEE